MRFWRYSPTHTDWFRKTHGSPWNLAHTSSLRSLKGTGTTRFFSLSNWVQDRENTWPLERKYSNFLLRSSAKLYLLSSHDLLTMAAFRCDSLHLQRSSVRSLSVIPPTAKLSACMSLSENVSVTKFSVSAMISSWSCWIMLVNASLVLPPNDPKTATPKLNAAARRGFIPASTGVRNGKAIRPTSKTTVVHGFSLLRSLINLIPPPIRPNPASQALNSAFAFVLLMPPANLSQSKETPDAKDRFWNAPKPYCFTKLEISCASSIVRSLPRCCADSSTRDGSP